MIDAYVKEQMGLNAPKEKVEEVPTDDRQALINALKTKWDAVNSRYQKITHMVKIESFGLLKRLVLNDVYVRSCFVCLCAFC